MFTGLVESIGRVAAVEEVPGGRRLRVETALAGDLAPGDSLAVSGVCLTVTALRAGAVDMDIGPETARLTTLGDVQPGARVNLERAMTAGARFGGHFVQGHVDGTGRIEGIRPDGDAYWVSVGFPGGLAPFLIPKGSVAVDGISLTVAALRAAAFDVMIIPFTWRATTLASRQVGDRVNLECDMIGKYVARTLELRG